MGPGTWPPCHRQPEIARSCPTGAGTGGAEGRDLGAGEPVYLVIQVDTEFAGANGTVQLQLCSDSTADLATSKTVHLDTGAIPVATLVAGYTKVMALPMEATYERYLGLWETVATTNISAGKINAFLTHDVAKWKAYADGI